MAKLESDKWKRKIAPGPQIEISIINAYFYFGTFQMLHEKNSDSVKIGTIQIPVVPGKGEVIPVCVTPTQLRLIHQKLVMW